MRNIERIGRVAGVGLIAAATLTGCDWFGGRDGNPTAQPTRTPTAAAGPKPGETPVPIATVVATATEVAKGAEIAGSLFSIRGVPDRVDANNVDTAKGGFKNTIPGTEHVLAEPGSLLVGPDFPQATIDQSGGHIDRFNPGNQYILQTEGPSFANVAEGAFMMASDATMNVEIGGAAIQLNGEKGRNWFLIVKGRFADGKQDSDLNLTAKITKYVPGHVLVSRHPAGAFISEGQFKQMAVTSHDGGSNCGNEGCSKLSALLLDINTGAYSVVEQVGKDQPWKMVASNWK